MSRLISKFERFANAQATEADKVRLFEAQKLTGIGDDDEMWMLIFTLQIYEAWFRKTPGIVRTECKGVIADARSEIEAAMNATSHRLTSRLQAQVDKLESASVELVKAQGNIVAAVIAGFAVAILLAGAAAWAFRTHDCRIQESSAEMRGQAVAALVLGRFPDARPEHGRASMGQ
jgi:hypothetical protein